MAERLTDSSDDFGQAADAFEQMARDIKSRQKGFATGKPASAEPPPAPEEIWVSRFGYRAISGNAGAGAKMALDAHAPVSFRPAQIPDLTGLKPVIPQMEPFVLKSELVPETAHVHRAAPVVTPVLAPRAVAVPQPMRAEPPKRSLLARLFGRD